MKQIKLRIYPDGVVQAEVEGVKGKKCVDYVSLIESLLDAEIVDLEFTSEYYEEGEVLYEDLDETVKINGGM